MYPLFFTKQQTVLSSFFCRIFIIHIVMDDKKEVSCIEEA